MVSLLVPVVVRAQRGVARMFSGIRYDTPRYISSSSISVLSPILTRCALFLPIPIPIVVLAFLFYVPQYGSHPDGFR
jgi:hypothetical protein